MHVKGIARIDKRTKDLVKRLQPGDIAVIDHRDIDEVSAESLVGTHIRAVINASESISGKYPNSGPSILLDAGIPILDAVGQQIMTDITEGDVVEFRGHDVVKGGKVIAAGSLLTRDIINYKLNESKKNLGAELDRFVENTLEYAKKEKTLILGGLKVPDVKCSFRHRHALIVVRGKDYREDLMAIRSYIEEVKPVKIGVDGGADALLELGYKPDMIVGDMDSITDSALSCGAEIVVHAYSDGRAPGLKRVSDLGLDAVVFPAPGTSEDIAMLLAYEWGAELIVAVGSHSNMIDFLEKGRKGMASTFLVRLKCGGILVDAKGVNKLYRGRAGIKHVAQIAIAALIPVAVIIAVSPSAKQVFRLLMIKLKVMLGI